MVSVTCKIKQKRKWKKQEKTTITTRTIITIAITKIKRMKIIDADNRAKKMRIIF